MSKFLISCGGTGGHLSPGIALAEGLRARGHSVQLLISQKKVDVRLSGKYPELKFTPIPGTGFGWNPAQLARCLVSQTRGLFFCLRLVRQERPDGIVAFGGFTSAGITLAGRFLGVPVALHEANRVPGRAVRWFGRCAQRVYVPVGIALAGVDRLVLRHMGLPVRREIARHPAAEARAALGLDPQLKVLAVLGGSQGASALNEWARREAPQLSAEGIQLYCVTGLGKGEPETIDYPSRSGVAVKAVFAPFCDRMAELMSAADLAVSRAGAGTLAELIRCETPAILVPFPKAADDHQRANALFFERQGGGLVVEQTALGGLTAQVFETISNEWLLGKFRENLRRMDRTHALDLMLRDLEDLVGATPSGSRGAHAPVG